VGPGATIKRPRSEIRLTRDPVVVVAGSGRAPAVRLGQCGRRCPNSDELRGGAGQQASARARVDASRGAGVLGWCRKRAEGGVRRRRR
jgi:hypothetical protein